MELPVVGYEELCMGRSQDIAGSEERMLQGLGTFFHGPGEATGGKAVKRVAELWVWCVQSQVVTHPVQPTRYGTQAIHIAVQGLRCVQETFHLCCRRLPDRSCLPIRLSKCSLDLCGRTPSTDTRFTRRRHHPEVGLAHV